MRQEADLEVREKPVPTPRKGEGKKVPIQEKQGKTAAPQVPFAGFFVDSGRKDGRLGQSLDSNAGCSPLPAESLHVSRSCLQALVASVSLSVYPRLPS